MVRKYITCLLALLFSSPLWADITEDGLPIIDIVYDGSTATVTIPSEVQDVFLNSAPGSSRVSLFSSTATQEYCYRVSGSTENGSLLLQGSYKLRLELAGCNIVNPTGAAIDVECGKRIAVVLTDGMYNYLEDGQGGSQKAALYFSGHPEFQGAGSLEVLGQTKHAISAKEYIELKEDLGDLRVLGAVSDGIHCGKGKKGNENNYFEMKGGEVSIQDVGSDCIDADDYGCVKLKGGFLSLVVSAKEGAGIKCDSLFSIKNNAILSMYMNGEDAEGIRCNYDARFEGGELVVQNAGAGAKAIKLKQKAATDPTATVVDGGWAHFNGTALDIVLEGANSISGDRCMAISVDRDMTLSAGTIQINKFTEQCKSYNVKGDLIVTNTGRIVEIGNRYDNEASQKYQNDMLIYASAQLLSHPQTDYANLQLCAYDANNSEILGQASVLTVAGGHSFLELRAYSDTQHTVGFKLFDASSGQEYVARETVTFKADEIVGTPSNPLALTFGNVLGDIDGDDRCTIADMARLVKLLNDTRPVYNKKADVNADGNLNIGDVKALEQLLIEE